jgi:hypothetical protein
MLAYRKDFPTPAVWLLAGTAAEAVEGAANTRQMLLVSDSQLARACDRPAPRRLAMLTPAPTDARTKFAQAPSETLYALLPAASSSKQHDAAGPLTALRTRAHELGPDHEGDFGVIRAQGVEKVVSHCVAQPSATTAGRLIGERHHQAGAQRSAPLTVPAAGVQSKAGSTSADQKPAAAAKEAAAAPQKAAGKKASLDWSRAKAPAPPPAAKVGAKVTSKRKMVVESDEEDEDAVEAMDVDAAPAEDEEEERIGYAMDGELPADTASKNALLNCAHP